MPKFFTLLVITIALLLPANSYAQKEYYNWIFGYHSGITFNTPDKNPIPLKYNPLYSLEGCASISDKNGNLLFYTDGDTVWNRSDSIMLNGTGLFGHWSSTQSAMIIKQPGNSNIYYIFTADQGGYFGANKGINYSVVDMNLDNSNGAITKKNIFLYQPATEKLIAIPHKSNRGYWILSHEWNSNKFKAYLFDKYGVSKYPVISSTGSVHQGTNDCSIGYMKSSPDHSKIALAVTYNKYMEILDFDNQTGVVTNPLLLTNSAGYDGNYGLEFSPDSRKLYYQDTNSLFQLNLNLSTSDSLYNERIEICKMPKPYFKAMQLGPNGKIYIGYINYEFLSSIDKPDIIGTACGITHGAVKTSLDNGFCLMGLPNCTEVLSGNQLFVTSDTICTSDTLKLFSYLSGNDTPKSYSWTGPNGFTSDLANPFILNATLSMAGNYQLEVTGELSKYYDTCNVTIYEKPTTKISAPDTIKQCYGSVVKLNITKPDMYIKYKWSTGETTPTINAAKTGKYSLTVENDNNCTNYSEVWVQYYNVPKVSISANTTFCENDTIILTAEPVDSNYIYFWSTGETSKKITITKPGTYSVKVENSGGCTDSASVTINPGLSANISASGPLVLCKGGILALYSHPQGKNYTCLWSTGETTPNINVTVPGKYKVVITFNNNCKDSSEIIIGNGLAPVVSITPSGSTRFCDGDSITLKAMAAGSVYKWGSFYFENFDIKKSVPEWFTKITNPDWQNPIKRDSSTNPKLKFLGVFGNQLVSLNLKNLPVHDSAEISFDFFALGTWDGCTIDPNGPDLFKIDERNSGFHFYTSFADHDIDSQAYPDTLPNCNNAMRRGSYGNYIVTTSQIVGDLTAYSLRFRFPHTTGNFNLDLNGILKESISSNLQNESWAIDNFRINLRMVVPDTASMKYLWSTGDTTSTVTANKSGDYKVVVENQSGCSDSASINVTVYPNPAVKFDCKTSICPGEIIKIKLTEKYTNYLWSNQEATSSITVDRADNFSVIVTDSNGCNGFGTITITQNPAAQFKILGEPSICKGSKAILSVDNNFVSYHWSTGDSTKDIIINDPGYYSVDVIDSNGCAGSAFKFLTQDSINYTGQIPFNFEDLCTGEQAVKEFILKNWSLTDSLIITDIRPETGNAFSMKLSKQLPIVLASLEETTVKVIFNPHEPVSYSDSTVLTVSYPCNGIFKSELTGRGILKTKVLLPDTIAVIGTKGFHIPLFMQLTCGEKFPDSMSFTGEIRYDATLMLPNADNPFISNSSISGQDRVISLKGSNVKIIKDNDSIGRFITDIFLASQNYTQLRITQFDNDNYLIYTDRKDGSITLKGFCQFPISRLQVIGIKYFEAFIRNELLITNYELLGPGDVRLGIFNQLGEEVFVPVNEYQQKGEHSYQFSVNRYQLPDGVYFMRLVAGGQILMEKVLLIK